MTAGIDRTPSIVAKEEATPLEIPEMILSVSLPMTWRARATSASEGDGYALTAASTTLRSSWSCSRARSDLSYCGEAVHFK